MAFIESIWVDEQREYYNNQNYNNSTEITKDDVIEYLKKHPELLDEIILLMRKEKVKKIKKCFGNGR